MSVCALSCAWSSFISRCCITASPTLIQFQSQPEVDTKRLGVLIDNLVASRDEIDAVGTQYLQPLKDSEFLSSIKHRSAIPGGTCEFDLLFALYVTPSLKCSG